MKQAFVFILEFELILVVLILYFEKEKLYDLMLLDLVTLFLSLIKEQ